jgi:hypothetical protein
MYKEPNFFCDTDNINLKRALSSLGFEALWLLGTCRWVGSTRCGALPLHCLSNWGHVVDWSSPGLRRCGRTDIVKPNRPVAQASEAPSRPRPELLELGGRARGHRQAPARRPKVWFQFSLERESDRRGGRSSIQHAARPDPGQNQPQWEGMVGARWGRVGAPEGGGTRGGGLPAVHLRRDVGKKRQATSGEEGKSLWWTALLLSRWRRSSGWGGNRGCRWRSRWRWSSG